MKVTPIFPEYIFEFDYPDHSTHKNDLVNKIRSQEFIYEPLQRREMFAKRKTGIITTHPDLHKEKVFIPIRDFMHTCINQAMGYLGFKEQSKITSMWANIQTKGTANPSHSHYNTYMTAVYYLYSSDGLAEGTTFHNANYTRYSIISPPYDYTKESKIRENYYSKFEEGKVVVFHGFMRHSTSICMDHERMIIGINSMPVGDTNRDSHDRYSYV
jgi:hypothetical protein